MAFHDEEGPGPAERAIFGAAKRKRPRIMARITRTVNELIFSRVKCALERAEVIFTLADINSENANQVGN